MLKRVGLFIKKIDAVGKETSLSFNGSTRIKTVCGGLLTTIATILIVAASYFLSKELFLREDPAVRTSLEPVPEAVINLKEFPLGFFVGDGKAGMIQNNPDFKRAVEIIGELRETNHPTNKEVMRIYTFKLKQCNMSEYGEIGETFKQLDPNINQKLCIDFDSFTTHEGKKETKEMIINAKMASRNSTYINIILLRCQEEKDPGCSKFFEKQGTFFFNSLHLDRVLNVSSYSNPLSYLYEVKNIAVSAELYIRQYFTFSINQLVSDDGWFLNEIEETKLIQIFEKNQEVQIYSPVTRRLLALYYDTTLTKQIIARKYIKVQEVLANLGGFLKVVISAMKFLASFFSEFEYYEEMRDTIDKKIKNPNFTNNFIKQGESNAELKIEANKLTKTTVIPKISMTKFIFQRAFCFWKSNIEESRAIASKYLEIRYMVKRFIEIEETHKQDVMMNKVN